MVDCLYSLQPPSIDLVLKLLGYPLLPCEQGVEIHVTTELFDSFVSVAFPYLHASYLGFVSL
jgi:hypothetical protein